MKRELKVMVGPCWAVQYVMTDPKGRRADCQADLHSIFRKTSLVPGKIGNFAEAQEVEGICSS